MDLVNSKPCGRDRPLASVFSHVIAGGTGFASNFAYYPALVEPMIKFVQLQRSGAMALRNARHASKTAALKAHDKLASWVFAFCTLLTLASVVHMWSHCFEIAATLGFYRAAGVLAAVTGAALVVSWWVNTGNE
jgi:hypothetical protein